MIHQADYRLTALTSDVLTMHEAYNWSRENSLFSLDMHGNMYMYRPTCNIRDQHRLQE